MGPTPLRFPWIVRLTHAVNAAALLLLAMSGLQIFNAHPTLYASDAADPARTVFALARPAERPAPDGPSPAAGGTEIVLLGRAVPVGPDAPARIPGFLTFGGWLAGARRAHFALAWVLVLNGAVYLAWQFYSGRWRAVWPTCADMSALPADARAHLRWPLRLAGPGGGYNAWQKLAYAAVIAGLVPFTIASGLALSPQWDAIWPFWTDVFGGRQFARTWHFAGLLLLAGFTFGHVALVALTRTWAAMLSGRTPEAPPALPGGSHEEHP